MRGPQSNRSRPWGVRIFEVTAISRDGLLEGPDLDLLAALAALDLGDVIASGGVSSLADVRAVANLGCMGAIVGRALYEGRNRPEGSPGGSCHRPLSYLVRARSSRTTDAIRSA